MSLKEKLNCDGDALDRAAGVTGIGWTTSLLGYVSTLAGYGNALVGNPQSFLYLGGALLVATLGLDRLRERLADGAE